MKCRHNLRIRIVITRTSKHHQDIVEGTKLIPDLVYLRVYYIDNIDGCRASYKNESREHFGSISKIANLPQLFSLCLLLCSGLLSFQLCLTRLKLSVSKALSHAFFENQNKFKIGGNSAIIIFNQNFLVTHSYNRL